MHRAPIIDLPDDYDNDNEPVQLDLDLGDQDPDDEPLTTGDFIALAVVGAFAGGSLAWLYSRFFAGPRTA